MAGSKSSAKRHAQSERRRVKNKSVRSEVRTSIKKFHQSVETNNKAETEKIFRETQQLLDSAAGKGVFHANTVARTKSRLVHRMNKLAAS